MKSIIAAIVAVALVLSFAGTSYAVREGKDREPKASRDVERQRNEKMVEHRINASDAQKSRDTQQSRNPFVERQSPTPTGDRLMQDSRVETPLRGGY